MGDIGLVLRELRIQRYMSQKKLSEGVCTQSMLSQIENSKTAPSIELAQKLAEKLGVDLTYIIKATQFERLDYIEEVHQQLRRLSQTRNYKELKNLVYGEKETPLFSSSFFLKKILLWHEGIVMFHIDNDIKKAVETLDKAIEIVSTVSNEEINNEIIISKANIFTEIKDYPRALANYNKVIKSIRLEPYVRNKFILVRSYYNLARLHRKMNNHLLAIESCQLAIKCCLNEQIMYALGDLNFETALNYLKLGNKKLAREYYHQAELVYKIQNNTEGINLITYYLNSKLVT